jgi:hypothetical protein
MRIHSESLIHHPLALVYDAYRNRLPEVAQYIPDIREIRVHKVDENDDGAEIHNEWISDTEMPRGINKIIRPEHLRWDDYATWNDGNHWVDWRIKTRVFTDSVQCSGRNRFVDEGGKTRVILEGDLQINISSIPGVPRIIGKRLTPKVESFIVRLVTPNLKRVNECLQTFLDHQVAS